MLDRLFSSATLISLVALGCFLSLGCDDPLARFEKAIDEGKRAAIADVVAEAKARSGARSVTHSTASGGFADDQEAKRKAGGVSIGPGEARRLYYQFIDARGRVAFVERLSDVPDSWRDKVGFVEMDSPPPLSPAMASRTRDARYAASGRRPAPRVAGRMPQTIVLYSADWCGWCKKAKRHLDGMGVNYEIRDIDIPANLNDLVAKTGQKGIPVLDVGGRMVTGFSPDEYERLIRSRT
jgi:glutaredoxin